MKTMMKPPLVWVPSLYFAQGLPFAVVMIMAAVMYKRLGVSNQQITYWTSLLGLAWAIKPFWSPFLELMPSKKMALVLFQVLTGLCLLFTALTLQWQGFFVFSIATLSLVAFSSATHDIVADGVYIENLSMHQQAIYAGWLGSFWNGAKLFVQGALVVLAGELESRLGLLMAWSVAVALPGMLLILLGVYHLWAIPSAPLRVSSPATMRSILNTMHEVMVTFFSKPGIYLALAFILLFRAGEGQVQTIGRLFLIEDRAAGGLGLSTLEMGIAYGTFSTLALIVGSILGGYFIAWRGLKKSMFILILAMNIPNLTFWYLSAYLPTNMYVSTIMLSIEMFGYGFGSTGLALYIMQSVAPGKYPTAHYAIGTGFMQLGLVISTMVSGKIQAWLGYHDFFIWGVLIAIPGLMLSLFVDLPEQARVEKVS
jgi:PAT family beta-lactamase induction signal transducer AmpG